MTSWYLHLVLTLGDLSHKLMSQTLGKMDKTDAQNQSASNPPQSNLSMRMTSGATPVNALKLPNFTPANPDLFFLLIEATLKQQGITDQEQVFLLSLMQLPERVQIQAKGLVNDSNVTNKLQKLKDIVDGIYNLTAEERLKKLLSSKSLGDMKPSEYLRHIRELQGTNSDPNSSLIRMYFIESLPSTIAPFVHMMLESHDLDSIAKMADKSANFGASRNKTAASTEVCSIDQKIDSIHEQISSLKFSKPTENVERTKILVDNLRTETDRKIENLASHFSTLTAQVNNIQQMLFQMQTNTFNPANRRSRSRSNSASSFSNNQDLCYYHGKFKERAHKCTPPCSFNSKFQPQGN